MPVGFRAIPESQNITKKYKYLFIIIILLKMFSLICINA